MTTTSPASMGGPLSESDRLAEIQARFKNRVTGHWHAVSIEFRGQTSHSVKSNVGSVLAHTGYGPIGGSSHANAEFMANAPADIEFLLNLVGVLEGQLATAREELGELLPIASPYRTTKADRDRNWLHGAWESFAARAKTARAAANRWAREADRLEEWAAKRKSEKDAGTWPPCQGCDEHPARALGLDGGGSGE